jgi:hypothetical protein
MTIHKGLMGTVLCFSIWMAQEAPQQHKPPPPKTSAYDQPLTGYEVAVLVAEFVQNLERGLSEAFEKPISTAGTGEVTLRGNHPKWVRPALLELKRRDLIPPQFNGHLPMKRYQVGIMLARYAQQLDACMRSQLGTPIGRTRFQTQPRIALPRQHPAYGALRYLAEGAWVGAESTLYREPEGTIRGHELPDMLKQFTQRILERYTREKHMEESAPR